MYYFPYNLHHQVYNFFIVIPLYACIHSGQYIHKKSIICLSFIIPDADLEIGLYG